MSKSISFKELASDEPQEDERKVSQKKTLEVLVKVAGPKAVEAKTVILTLDNRGLIKLAFAEGGELPELLKGRFTSLADVAEALEVWVERRAKQYNLVTEIQRDPKASEQSVASLLAAQRNSDGRVLGFHNDAATDAALAAHDEATVHLHDEE
jgi:hypothetical protein